MGSAIAGAGATRLTLTIDTLVVVLFQLPLSLWAVTGMAAHPTRLWWVLVSTSLVFATCYVVAYRRGKFLKRLSA